MEIKNKQLIPISNVLYSFADKKVPFSLVIARNSKIVNLLIEDYNKKRLEIINEFATLTESGAYLGIFKPVEGDDVNAPQERFENPTNFNEMEIEDKEGMFKQIQLLDEEVIEIDLVKIDLTKTYFDSALKEKLTVGDFIDTNVEANLVNLLSEFELISL